MRVGSLTAMAVGVVNRSKRSSHFLQRGPKLPSIRISNCANAGRAIVDVAVGVCGITGSAVDVVLTAVFMPHARSSNDVSRASAVLVEKTAACSVHKFTI